MPSELEESHLKSANGLNALDDESSLTVNASTGPFVNSNGQKLPSAVEFEPPLACVRRILKRSLPSSTNVGKDACAAFARACGIFIIYITTCSNDFARENKRQTITALDVIAAVQELDFEEFTADMLAFLESYRDAEKRKKSAKAAALVAANNEADDDDEEDDDDDVGASTKEHDNNDEDEVDEDEEEEVVVEEEDEDDDEETGPERKRARFDGEDDDDQQSVEED